MTAIENYRRIFESNRRTRPIDERDAAWYWCDNPDAYWGPNPHLVNVDSLDAKDFRESPQGLQLAKRGKLSSYIEPIFGTDNKALREYCNRYGSHKRREWTRLKTRTGDDIHRGGYYGLEQAASCHASSIVWLKYALTGDPHQMCNVHELKTEEIYQTMKGLYIDINTRAGGQRTLRQMAERARLTRTNVPQEDRIQLLRRLNAHDRIGMVILMDGHVIGLYKASSALSWNLYCFDNTVGCLHFRNQSSLFIWLDWACERNDEPNNNWKAAVICRLG
jgi:hypothetical protein